MTPKQKIGAWRRWDRAYRALFDAEIRWLENGARVDNDRTKVTEQWIDLLEQFAALFADELKQLEAAQEGRRRLQESLHRMATDEEYVIELLKEAKRLDKQQ